MCQSFTSTIEVSFYILCNHYNYIKLYLSVDSHILQRLYTNNAYLEFE